MGLRKWKLQPSFADWGRLGQAGTSRRNIAYTEGSCELFPGTGCWRVRLRDLVRMAGIARWAPSNLNGLQTGRLSQNGHGALVGFTLVKSTRVETILIKNGMILSWVRASFLATFFCTRPPFTAVRPTTARDHVFQKKIKTKRNTDWYLLPR